MQTTTTQTAINQATIELEQPELLALPRTSLAREVLDLVTLHASASLANHSIRSFLFARLVAHERGLREGRDYEPELLFCACALHDMGLTDAGDRGQRFEVDGADFAAGLLARHGVPAAEVDLVWQAIALNSSPGIVERRGTLGALTFAGVAIDFTGDAPFVTVEMAAQIHEAYPRLAIGKTLADAIVQRARRAPERAPLFSMPAQLLRDRAKAPHLTELECLALSGRWGQ
jgi:HD domain-containing protein